MSSPSCIVIASRESRLAMWQAEHVRARLQALHPSAEVKILGMTTRGDQILDRPLNRIGGKGLFVKELESALQAGHADLAVHSMKDVPMDMPEGFALAAILARETPFDAFVSTRCAHFADLPAGARVGTSSLRREALLRRHYPHLAVQSLRGNLETRLRKLDEGHYDAIVLAAAGLVRLGLAARIRAILPADEFLPAPGQGALGIEILATRTDAQEWVAPLNDPQTARCVGAERALSRVLEGSCQLPLGAYAHIGAAGEIHLRGFLSSADGQTCVAGAIEDSPDADEALVGLRLARWLREHGGDEILAQLAQA
jgi:hydroxymethylbilane synthase